MPCMCAWPMKACASARPRPATPTSTFLRSCRRRQSPAPMRSIPGSGFLAENARFADMVTEHGFVFIGPSSDHIRLMGDKVKAKQAARDFGIPTVPGSDGAVGDAEHARKLADNIGYPILVKAAGGGGGRGMRVAESADTLGEAFAAASAEARVSFGNTEVYLEQLSRPTAPYRGADPRRRPGRRGASRRARLLAAAQTPEGARGDPLSRPQRQRTGGGDQDWRPTPPLNWLIAALALSSFFIRKVPFFSLK